MPSGHVGCPPCLLLQALSLVLDVLCGVTSKEGDGAVREALAEAVLCLARVDSARKQLWKCDAPTLLQKGCVCCCLSNTLTTLPSQPLAGPCLRVPQQVWSQQHGSTNFCNPSPFSPLQLRVGGEPDCVCLHGGDGGAVPGRRL